jgi:hypothetical protein
MRKYGCEGQDFEDIYHTAFSILFDRHEKNKEDGNYNVVYIEYSGQSVQ